MSELTILNVKEAAIRTGLSKQTIWRAIANGELRAYKVNERKNAIILQDLEHWAKTMAPAPRPRGSRKNNEPANYQFGIDPHPDWPFCAEDGHYWECTEHEIHGTALNIEEATMVAYAHQLFYRTENGACMVHMFPVNK